MRISKPIKYIILKRRKPKEPRRPTWGDYNAARITWGELERYTWGEIEDGKPLKDRGLL